MLRETMDSRSWTCQLKDTQVTYVRRQFLREYSEITLFCETSESSYTGHSSYTGSLSIYILSSVCLSVPYICAI
jgi:hypothetical protein